MSAPSQSVYLTLATEGGEDAVVELRGPGGTIRCAVGEPGRRSGVWRVWANKKTSDVYIAIRTLAGTQKWSLHESGDWRHQWTREFADDQFPASTNRIIDQWQQPPALGDSGWTKGLSIWVRHEDVVAFDGDDETGDKVTWLPVPPEGYAVGMHVVIASPDLGFTSTGGGVLIDAFSIADKRVVMVVRSLHKVTEQVNAELQSARQRALDALEVDLTEARAPRILIAGFGSGSERVVWDLSV
jgi:hypothetical protein